MTADERTPQEFAFAKLREPFPDHQVSLLPKQVTSGRDQAKGKCEPSTGRQFSADGRYCGGYHAKSIHLDYVGHAALTDRLLDADPLWSWEPCAYTEAGLPAFDRDGGLWIRLTVAGVTRLGYGDAAGKTGPNATKEAIGDALRNAGMRFGAALDLWHKGDLHDASEEQGTEASPEQRRPAGNQAAGVWPDREHSRDDWRRFVLGIETLAGSQGLRAGYQLVKDAGVLGEQVVEGEPETFAALMQRLSRELPETAGA